MGSYGNVQCFKCLCNVLSLALMAVCFLVCKYCTLFNGRSFLCALKSKVASQMETY